MTSAEPLRPKVGARRPKSAAAIAPRLGGARHLPAAPGHRTPTPAPGTPQKNSSSSPPPTTTTTATPALLFLSLKKKEKKKGEFEVGSEGRARGVRRVRRLRAGLSRSLWGVLGFLRWESGGEVWEAARDEVSGGWEASVDFWSCGAGRGGV